MLALKIGNESLSQSLTLCTMGKVVGQGLLEDVLVVSLLKQVGGDIALVLMMIPKYKTHNIHTSPEEAFLDCKNVIIL